MKRSFFLLLVLLLCLTACGKQTAPAVPTVTPQASTTAQTTADTAPTDTTETAESTAAATTTTPATTTATTTAGTTAVRQTTVPTTTKAPTAAATNPTTTTGPTKAVPTTKQTTRPAAPVTTTAPRTTTARTTTAPTTAALRCSISIACDTALRSGALDEAQKAVLPQNGVLLTKTTVSFQERESVFDVLQRTCRANGIPMEFTMTPVYQSAYIEGIGNLYEFDCGAASGWMYAVNGVYPNYGCSKYPLKPGDVITWRYTCDLGADIGGAGVKQN